MSEPAAPGTGAPDLTRCDLEPIHWIGRVQEIGCLLALCKDWVVRFASENTHELLGVDAQAALGQPLASVLGREFAHEARNQTQVFPLTGDTSRLFAMELAGKRFDITVTLSDERIYLLEFEASAEESQASKDALLRTIMARLKAAPSLQALCGVAARSVRMISEFDRVMIYRFLEDGAGEVIAEARTADAEPYLGLRYPASDIPQQARRLYLRKLIRLVADVNAPTPAIVPARGADGNPLDLSDSSLRAVSPVHLEYLRNMGVASSMSISLVVDGRLWGLIACHHRTPYRPSLPVRTVAELVGQVMSLLIESRERVEEQGVDDRIHAIRDRVLERMNESDDPVQALLRMSDSLMELMDADGLGYYHRGCTSVHGDAPSDEEFLEIVGMLHTLEPGKVFVSDCLGQAFPGAERFASEAAGLLAIPVSREPRDYLVFFRMERVHEVTWAGNPDKPIDAQTPQGISPRKSFAAWKEQVRGCSRPWSTRERALGEALRYATLEIVLRHADQIDRERRMSVEKQDLLIAELNHRVRNILSLVRALLHQSSDDQRSVSEFVSSLGSRVDALARAHDLLTRDLWAPGSLRDLILDEFRAYVGPKADRIRIRGTDVGLRPDALSTVAMVLHELTTNAAKYGALCDRRGHVVFTLTTLASGDLDLHWEEIGGPPVKPPQRSGFGSTVIERAVPFTLGGTASVKYLLAGLQVHVCIPARHVVAISEVPHARREVAEPVDATDRPLSGNVLLVEDNMLIAMNAETYLRELGAEHVDVASSVERALTLIERVTPAAAFLDVNLGDETSFGLADQLLERAVPVAFMSGYTDGPAIPARFGAVPKVSKPYKIDDIRRVARSLNAPS